MKRVLLCLGLIACVASAFMFHDDLDKSKERECTGRLKMLDKLRLNYVKDVSALTFDNESGHLLVADRETGNVYCLDRKGKKSNVIKTGVKDIQGMYLMNKCHHCERLEHLVESHHQEDKFLVVLSGKNRAITAFDLHGKRLGKSIRLPIKSGEVKGLAVNVEDKMFFVVRSGNPATFYALRMDKNMKPEIVNKKDIRDVRDITDLEFDEEDKTVWAVTTNSENAVLKLSCEGEILGHWESDIERAQGIGIGKDKLFVAVRERGGKTVLGLHKKPICKKRDFDFDMDVEDVDDVDMEEEL